MMPGMKRTLAGKQGATLALALAAVVACSGKRGHAPSRPPVHAAGTSTAAGGDSAEAGQGGFSEDGGRAGRAGASVGGTGGFQASAGNGGTRTAAAGSSGGGTGGGAGAASGTGSSSGAPAAGWTCAATRYHDGESCDCGCGVVDPDCQDETAASCDNCRQLGSCAAGSCPSSVMPDDNSRCGTPEGWLCGSLYYGDGFCDCGCGVLDIDCESQQGDACLSCPLLGCARNLCATIDPDDNTLCTAPPLTWKCNERFYRDGVRCDCGCGFPDPDCTSNELSACDACNGEGSCSGQPCPGLIDPEAIHACVQPYPPSEWRCGPDQYGSGQSCDCGCGAPDPDCRSSDAGSCDSCACNSNRCPESVDPNDTTQCAPAPPGWTCPEFWFSNGLCECGCGVLDVDCAGAEADYCQICDQGCAHGHCERIRAKDNTRCSFEVPSAWTCSEAVYWDDVCDCGCGALDADCSSLAKSSCDLCNSDGSCSSVACKDAASTILPDDNTRCSE
jgi:hypothetical protein